MTIAVGDTLPGGMLTTMGESGPEPVNVEEFFKGKTVALFSVPGAFTPTCSARHLPGFVEKAGDLKAKGVDEIACLAVNDAFVLGAWAQSQDAVGTVTMLADGTAAWSKSLGLDVDLSNFGMGVRSQRFSMVVTDGRVTHLFVEEGGAFEVSSAEHMLGAL